MITASLFKVRLMNGCSQLMIVDCYGGKIYFYLRIVTLSGDKISHNDGRISNNGHSFPSYHLAPVLRWKLSQNLGFYAFIHIYRPGQYCTIIKHCKLIKSNGTYLICNKLCYFHDLEHPDDLFSSLD